MGIFSDPAKGDGGSLELAKALAKKNREFIINKDGKKYMLVLPSGHVEAMTPKMLKIFGLK